MNHTSHPTSSHSSSDAPELPAHIESRLAEIRARAWEGTPPPLARQSVKSPARTSHRALALSLLGITTTGLAFGGYHLASRSWTASVKVEGKDVQVIYNGQPVPPDQVEWLENGHCLITINGARILLDPTQPGGAAASISVSETPTPPTPPTPSDTP